MESKRFLDVKDVAAYRLREYWSKRPHQLLGRLVLAAGRAAAAA